MSDLVNGDQVGVIIDQVDDAIVALADSVPIGVPGELFRATGPRIGTQTLNLGNDALAVSLGPYCLQLLPCGRFDEKAI
jgi:hypothetical protein